MGTPPRRWDRKSGSCSQRQANNLCLGRGAGVGGAREGHFPLPLPPSFVPILELGTGLPRFYFLPRALTENPIPCLSAPVLLCFSGMCFHLKTTLGRFLFPVLKIEKFLQYKQGCGGGGVGAVRGHSECILALGWDGWGGRTPTSSPPPPIFFLIFKECFCRF